MRRAANPWDRFYRAHAAPWRGERQVADLLPFLGPGPVLELGVGNGKTLRPLVGHGLRVVGLDVSWHVLQGVREAADVVLADAAVLPFAAGSFTAVLDMHCTGHLPRKARREALREALRVVEPGGTLVQERLGSDDLRAQSGDPLEGGGRRLQDGRCTWFLPEAQVRHELEDAGWHVADITRDRRSPTHRGVPVLRENVRAVARSAP